ncbi:MAG: hypothetical protein L0Y44_16700 [Phycisphaerales bacterium]|nr:hypothetical protein [Phycisphaerales bacterium]
MYQFLKTLDRRWVFLLMFLAVALPILLQAKFPETPSPMVRDVFNAVNDLPSGSKVLMAFDYDPGSKGELSPMAAAFTRLCCERRHKMYFMTLWPLGPPMVQANIDIIENEYQGFEYGRDYVNLGYKPGLEGVIKVVVTSLKELYLTDHHGKTLHDIPMTRDLKNVQEMDLIISVSAGYAGSKEWVQYAASPYGIPMVSGSTGVQAPALYPYIPRQMIGVLGAIKAAAEFEQVVIESYPNLGKNPNAAEGLRRMGPQFVAHMLMIALIVLGNVIFFIERRKGISR